MRRIKIITNYKQYKAGDTLEVTNNVAFGLIDKGVAVISKDMTSRDYVKTKKAVKRG